MRYLSINLEGKMLVWFEESNRYAMMEQPAYDVFVRLFGDHSTGPVDQWFAEKYNLPISEAMVFIDEVQQLVIAANQHETDIGIHTETAFPTASSLPTALPTATPTSTSIPAPTPAAYPAPSDVPIPDGTSFLTPTSTPTPTPAPIPTVTAIPGKPDAPVSQPASDMHSARQYRFPGTAIVFEYGDRKIESLVHPLLAHLEVTRDEHANKVFRMFQKDNQLFLFEGIQILGQWTTKEPHLFKGKLFLYCLNALYHREEHDWLAMLHASAVSDGESALLIAGNSGAGKSTALAVLLGSGLKYITDDFVPLDAAQRFVFPFPVAISVKEGAFGTVERFFPELEEIPASAFKTKGEGIKYLSPPEGGQNIIEGKPVKGIVFIEYKPGVKVELKEISKTDAFHRIVTESWVSPDYKNVGLFFNWFKEMPCYKLSYSDNCAMVQKVKDLFQDAT
jgi:hypothetical protein